MVALKTHFDGEKIEVPNELRGAAPGEVVVVYSPSVGSNLKGRTTSMWDVFGKAQKQRSTEDINAQVRELRDEWGD